VSVSESRCSTSNDYVNLIEVIATSSGEEVTVAGVLAGKRGIEKLVRVYGYDIDMAFAPVMAFFRYQDRPGVVGIVGSLLGEAGVNIANMQVSRHSQGGEALMGLALDSPVPAPTLDHIAERAALRDARVIVLDPH
jgi:D-3-phosphoglycerate dehydrogenase